MTKKAMRFDSKMKHQLLERASNTIKAFAGGMVKKGDPSPLDWGEYGLSFFDGYTVRYTEEFVKERHQFTALAVKMLKARNAHENTIRTLCQKAGQEYVRQVADSNTNTQSTLESAAKKLVETVLAEAGKEYTHIVPNFLIKHSAQNDVLTIGRVRSMPTESATANTALAQNTKIKLVAGGYPNLGLTSDPLTLGMPGSVWVVDVPATKENVATEAKWLIDVAISLMRLSTNKWQGVHPGLGEMEAHPTHPPLHAQPCVTMEGDTAFALGGKLDGFYVTNKDVAMDLAAQEIQSRARILFDPPDKSLAQNVALGLGWLTRGRQASDRAERLLFFFTALEALLTGNGKNESITQTISRHLSVILTQDIEERVTVFDHVKGLYGLRSDLIHKGRREVLEQDVNRLQYYAEGGYWTVLNYCDLSMSEDDFAHSLRVASHGMRWQFSDPRSIPPTTLHS